MNRLACALLLVMTATALSAGDDAASAAQDARSKRKKSTTRVITNEDVKKSKGKIIENKVPMTPIDTTVKPGEVEQHETARLARIAREEKIAAIDKEIAVLEAELLSIERAYFEENDPNVRDGAIAKRFLVVQGKLDAKRKERQALDTP